VADWSLMRIAIGSGLSVAGFGLGLLIGILDWQEMDMAMWIVVLLIVLSLGLFLGGLAVAGWGVIVAAIHFTKPKPIVLKPDPVVVHIDRNIPQMVQFSFNKIKRRLARSWDRLRHGL